MCQDRHTGSATGFATLDASSTANEKGTDVSDRTSRLLATGAALALAGGVFAGSALSATSLKLNTGTTCCKFSTKSLSAKAGSVTITLTNKDSVGHNVAIKGGGVSKKGPVVAKGKTSKVTATLKKGKTYTFYCSVPGHEAAGMKGSLKVK